MNKHLLVLVLKLTAIDSNNRYSNDLIQTVKCTENEKNTDWTVLALIALTPLSFPFEKVCYYFDALFWTY